MDLRPLDLIGGFYADDSKPWSVQDTVNWLPEVAEVPGTRTLWKLANPPGLRPFAPLGTKPVRGLHDVEGALFAVIGTQLHQVHLDGTSTVRGTIPGVGRVQMAHNQVTGGNQLLITNGQSNGYVFNTATSTFAAISDDAYPGAKSLAYMDSYLLQVEPFGRFWFTSDLADALSYSSLDRYESEAAPDKIVGLAVSQFEVVMFNETTIEFFYNAGESTGTFQNKRVLIERGCASAESIAKLDNSLMWLGDDGVVYRLDGYQAIPVSTGPVQEAIKRNNWKQAFAFTWEEGKHKVYYLTFPDGRTWGYDVVTKVWHRRESYGLNRWRLNHLVRWNNKWIGSDFQTGKLWILEDGYMLEGDQSIVSEHVPGVLHANQLPLWLNYVELLMSMGLEETVAPVVDGGGESSWQPLESSDIPYTLNQDMGSIGQPGASVTTLSDSVVTMVRNGTQLGGGAGWSLVLTGGGDVEIRITSTALSAADGATLYVRVRDAAGAQDFSNTSPTPTSSFLPSPITATASTDSLGCAISLNGLLPSVLHTSSFLIEVRRVP